MGSEQAGVVLAATCREAPAKTHTCARTAWGLRASAPQRRCCVVCKTPMPHFLAGGRSMQHVERSARLSPPFPFAPGGILTVIGAMHPWLSGMSRVTMQRSE